MNFQHTRSTNLIAVSVFLLCASTTAHSQSVKVWINAFIPSAHDKPNYIRPRPGHPGEFMLPGPTLPGTDIPIPGVGNSCYNTNNRGFSDDIKARSKLSVSTELSVGDNGIASAIQPPPELDPTEQYDCETGALKATSSANPTVSVSKPAYAAGTVSFTVKADAANPFAPPGSPSIKFEGTISLDMNSGRARFQGAVAQFPSYEAYVAIDHKAPIALFKEQPVSQSTAWSLALNRSIDKTVEWNPVSGSWTSNDPGQRWQVSIKDDSSFSASERDALGREYGWSGRLSRGEAGYFRISRENDAGVLQFLGFSGQALADILARTPSASFMDIRRQGDTVTVSWHGLLATKDSKGRVITVAAGAGALAKTYRLVAKG